MSARLALVIANTEYTDPGLAQLTAPGKDAEDFARVLQDRNICGFDDVKVLLNQVSSTVIETIDEFFDQKRPDDLLVLFFSGHGVRDEQGSLYLAVKNTIRSRLRSTAIKSDYIREVMDQSRSRRQVLVLDCCNSGAFAQGTKAEIGGTMGLVSAFQGYGRYVLTATDATQFAWEGNQVIGETENSLFTHFLVKGLEGEADSDGDGKITVDELYDYAFEQIVSITPKQKPNKSATRQEGEIILRQFTRLEDIKPIALPDDLISEMEDIRPLVREGAVQRLAKILNGKNIGLRRSAIEALEKIVIDENTTRRVAQLATQALEIYKQVEQKAEAERKAKEEAERLAFLKAEEERLAQEKAEAERKAQEEAEKLQRARAAREAAEREAARLKAEREAEEQAAREAAEKAVKEKAEKEAAEREAAQKAEREAMELALRKKEEREAAERAEREAIELAARRKLEREKREQVTASQRKTTISAPALQKPPMLKWAVILVIGLCVLGGGIWGISNLASMINSPATAVPTLASAPTESIAADAFTEFTPTPIVPLEPQDLRVNIGTYPDTLDPQKASFTNEIDFLNLVYSGLTTWDRNMETVPGAAESWEYNSDATELTFKLKDNLQYSDGSLLNAKRFEFALIRNIDPTTGGEYASLTDEIVGASDWRYADTTASGYDPESYKAKLGIKAMRASGANCTGYDDTLCNTLRLRFTKPAPYFHTVMSLWITYPAKEENIINGGQIWWNGSLYQIGNGPFLVKNLEPSVRIYFVPNTLFNGTVPSYNIEFKYIADTAAALEAYKNNEVDIINLSGQDLNVINSDAQLNSQKMIYPGSCTTVLKFGLAGNYTGTTGKSFSSPFSDIKVREAFALGFDAEGWSSQVDQGFSIPTWTWIPPGYPGFDANSPLSYNPERARQALAESTYGGPDALNALGLKLTIRDTDRDRQRGEFIVANYKEVLGVNITLEAIDSTAYTSLVRDPNTFPLIVRQGWCDDFPDPYDWLSVYWKSDSYFAQRQGYNNTTVDGLLNEADQPIDSPTRIELYKKAQQELLNDFPAAFGYNSANAYLVKPWVKNVTTTPHDYGWPGSIVPWTITIDSSLKP